MAIQPQITKLTKNNLIQQPSGPVSSRTLDRRFAPVGTVNLLVDGVNALSGGGVNSVVYSETIASAKAGGGAITPPETSYIIGADYVSILSVATALDSVCLPDVSTGTGRVCYVKNDDNAQTLAVYSYNTTDTINSRVSTEYITIAPGNSEMFVNLIAGSWHSFPLGGSGTGGATGTGTSYGDYQYKVTSFVNFVTTEPGAPSTGDRYINTNTGASSGTAQAVVADAILEWNGTDWTSTPAAEGMRVWESTANQIFVYNAEWILSADIEATLITYYGGETTGDDLTIKANEADAYPAMTLNGLGIATLNSTFTLTPATNVNGINVVVNALTTGQGINATHTTTVIADGGSVGNFSSTSIDTATTTGAVLNVSSTAQATGNTVLITSSGLTTGTAVEITGGAAVITTTGDLLSLVGNSSTTSTGLLRVSGTGLTDGWVSQLTGGGATATATGGVLDVVAGASTLGSAIRAVSTGAYVGTTGVLAVTATNTTTGNIAVITGGGAGMSTAVGSLLTLENGGQTDGAILEIFNTTGVYTGTVGIVNIDADALTIGTVIDIDVVGLTSGNGIIVNGGGANMVTGGSLISLSMGAAIAGSGLEISSTGDYTGTDGLLNIVANTATSGTLNKISATSLTSGIALSILGNGISTNLVTNDIGGIITANAADVDNDFYGLQIYKSLNQTASGVGTTMNNEALLIESQNNNDEVGQVMTISSPITTFSRVNDSNAASADVFTGVLHNFNYTASTFTTGTATNDVNAISVAYAVNEDAGTLDLDSFNVVNISYDTTGTPDYTASNVFNLVNVVGIDTNVPTYGADAILRGINVDLTAIGVTDANLTLYGISSSVASGTSTVVAGRFVDVNDGALGAVVQLFQNSASPAIDDVLGRIDFRGEDSTTGTDLQYAYIDGIVVDPTAGALFGGIEIFMDNGTGTASRAARFEHDGAYGIFTTGEIITDANVGTAGAGVTAVEYGNGRHHITVLTFTALVVGTPNAGNNSSHGVEIYAFPTADVHLHSHTWFSVGLTVGSVTTDQPDVGIGSVVGSGANATLNGGTQEDYVTGITWATPLDGTARVQDTIAATAGVFTGISNNATGDVKEIFLNAADGWNAGVTGNLTATGTVVLIWDSIA